MPPYELYLTLPKHQTWKRKTFLKSMIWVIFPRQVNRSRIVVDISILQVAQLNHIYILKNCFIFGKLNILLEDSLVARIVARKSKKCSIFVKFTKSARLIYPTQPWFTRQLPALHSIYNRINAACAFLCNKMAWNFFNAQTTYPPIHHVIFLYYPVILTIFFPPSRYHSLY